MAQCRMEVDKNRQCGKYLWKCKGCGVAGCDNRNCKNQTFDPGNGMCLRCLKTGAR